MKLVRVNDMEEISGRCTIVLLKKPCRVGGGVEKTWSGKHAHCGGNLVVTAMKSMGGWQLMWTSQLGVADVHECVVLLKLP